MNYSSASSANERLQTFYQHINCSSIEVTDITKDIDVIVDDEGLLVSGNPVLEVVHKKHPDRIHHLAGVLLFGKNKVSDDGVETVGFSNEHEAGEFIRNLKIK